MIPSADQNNMITPGGLEHREIPNPEKHEFERNEIDPVRAPDEPVDDPPEADLDDPDEVA